MDSDLRFVISDPNHDEGFYEDAPLPFLKERYVQRGDTYYFKKKPGVAAFTERDDTVEVQGRELELGDPEQLIADFLKIVEDRGSLNIAMYDVPADIAILVKTKVEQARLRLDSAVRKEKDGFAEIFSEHREHKHQREKEEEEEAEQEAERAHEEEPEVESKAEHEREPEQTTYVIPTITLSGSPPLFVVADNAPEGVKAAVNSANLALKVKRSQQGVTPAEMDTSTLQILENAKARSLLAVQADDLAKDRLLVAALVLEKSNQSNIGLTAVRCEPAITGINLDNGVVMRENPRNGNLYVWIQPAENQQQRQGKVLIISPSQQENMPQLKVGDHTDGLKAGERQLAQTTSLTRKGPLD
ncbi:MAG TPA: hypothetical protein VM532_17195 [Burkholderiales bacterium]|jgi:hypothetical protein|nr:hypothetical protein [Burkholderiales bacterium]